VPAGRWFRLAVYMANEFGLWRRDDFPSPADALPLRLQLFPSPVGLRDETHWAIYRV
jgi:hypothetical protein